MILATSALLGIAFAASETGLAVLKRSRDDSVDADEQSLRTLWLTVVVSVSIGIAAAHLVPDAAMHAGDWLLWTGAMLFGGGLALRWYSIIYLGRYFTVNVAIHSGHEIIDTGPYSQVRHPSYAGALAAFAGIALCLGNWLSLAAIMLPVALAFRNRIVIEETALSSALGSPYVNYMRRTRRLIPFIY